MPWKECRIVDQRLQFLSSYQKEEMSVSDLCREFEVSRPTGYRSTAIRTLALVCFVMQVLSTLKGSALARRNGFPIISRSEELDRAVRREPSVRED
jgi:hypothetical protein